MNAESDVSATRAEWKASRAYPVASHWYSRLDLDNDIIDLGNRQFLVMRLPGHSPGSICLWEEATGSLYTGDLIYDGPLVYEGPGMDLNVYAESLRRLKALPVLVVHAGHNPSFDRARMIEIIDSYLTRWGMHDAVDC